ncbi:YjbE family integral membrane protein [Tumebacillus sp. BK434]|uniref:TerC family protein n=1 Tax=Tumebacillus sp. BK434 TaxID=2512169 RepID=UPI0010E201E9|nr:TerC family protein [Tumebacillus sp. BK434]TCP58313.1 YjbE family integral membrane protein [Tumebacillus sp. BK434]
MQELLLALEILLISAILSVDNALVIGLATRTLPNGIRQRAIYWGTFGAVALRLVLSALALYLINLPYIKLVGGLFLLYIAYKMLGEEHLEAGDMRSSRGIWKAVQMIVIADLMVSIDNVLAVVAIADGNWWLVALGILVSIPCILWGSRLISHLLHKYPILLFLGIAVLSWTGAAMILEEKAVALYLTPLAIPNGAFYGVTMAATGMAWLTKKRTSS